jgi:hypothetical protein
VCTQNTVVKTATQNISDQRIPALPSHCVNQADHYYSVQMPSKLTQTINTQAVKHFYFQALKFCLLPYRTMHAYRETKAHTRITWNNWWYNN